MFYSNSSELMLHADSRNVLVTDEIQGNIFFNNYNELFRIIMKTVTKILSFT